MKKASLFCFYYVSICRENLTQIMEYNCFEKLKFTRQSQRNMTRQLLIFCLFSFYATLSMGQMRLNNSSFEGAPQDATVPTGWFPCERGSTPDILPGPWNVFIEASEGETYMGLITREDGSWESVGQRLRTPLKNTKCYKFSLDLAHSRNYAGYNEPIKLRIWAGRTKCSKEQILGQTQSINHSDWRTYKFQFFAKGDYNYIILEAFYSNGSSKRYKGNILIDAVSKIEECTRA